MKDYIKEIQSFITDYEAGLVEVSPGCSYSMRDLNQRISELYHAQFRSGGQDQSGFILTFMRKAWVVFRTLIMNSDLDLKHLNIRSINGVKVRFVSILRMAFYSHLSRGGFGEIIDKILEEMCWFGSSIVKRVDGQLYTVNLDNYITEPNVRNPQERRHLEMCYYSYDQMESHKEDWKESWSDIERVWEKMQQQNESKFKVIEFWTFNEKGQKVCVKALDQTILEKSEFYNASEWSPYLQLDVFRTPEKKKRLSKRIAKALGEFEDMFPYEQFDLFNAFGRQQCIGVGELLLDLSIVYNTVFNTTIKNVQKASLGVHIHNSVQQGSGTVSQLVQEAITNLAEGGVISIGAGETLSNFPFDAKVADFDLLENKLYELMRQIIGITQQGTGEEIPASTSATQASINQQNANTVYDFVRERVHHGIKRLFNNGYAEDILDELDEKELVAITGDPTQLEELDAFLLDEAMNKWAESVKNTAGIYPTEEEFMQVKEQLKQDLIKLGDTRFPAIKKAFIKDMEYLIEFDMTGESVDNKARFDALSSIKNDPGSTKSKAKVEDEILHLQGLNPRNYEKTAEEKAQEQAMLQAQMAGQQGAVQAPAPIQ